jgi:hypothetical protein
MLAWAAIVVAVALVGAGLLSAGRSGRARPVTGPGPGIPAASPLATSAPTPGCPLPAVPSGQSSWPVTGTIYFDRNQDGTQDPGEPGLAGVAVYLSHGADSETPGEDKRPASCTDSSGHYRLTAPDDHTGYRLEIRSGWFRSQCPALTCPVGGGAGNNVAAGPEWVYSAIFTGATAHRINAGLIPDAGQYVPDAKGTRYAGYPPDLSRAHAVDIAARFTVDDGAGCTTAAAGTACRIGQEIDQSLYIANSGTEPVSGIQAVIQLPYGEVHNALTLLRSGTSPGVTAISHVVVLPVTGPRTPGKAAIGTNFTTVRLTLDGILPPGGLATVLSRDTLLVGPAGAQVIGRAGVTYEDAGIDDADSVFCAAPALAVTCAAIGDTHSFLDRRGDDNDSDRFLAR